MSTDHHSGLKNVEELSSSISFIKDKELRYRGILIDELAAKCSFEEVVYLLWYGRLPGKKELDRLIKEIQENSHLIREIKDQIQYSPRKVHPQIALSHLLISMGLYDDELHDTSSQARYRVAIRIISKIPTLVFGFNRYRKAKSIIEPRNDLRFAANCLYLLHGEEPNKTAVDALEKCFILYADHGLNASTFAVRITTGTMADLYSAVTSGIVTLNGPLNGGANQKAMEMLLDINDIDSVKEWIDERLSSKKRIMGFGHVEHKQGDPRTDILKKICGKLCQPKEYKKYYQIAISVEEYVFQKLNLKPNIDFYSGLIFYVLGFPIDMFTSVFTMARVSGWISHIMEQYENNYLVHPKTKYTGKQKLKYIPMKER